MYQEVAGERREVVGGYVLDEGGRVGFKVGEYDARLPLVIDPTLVYSTYLGTLRFAAGESAKTIDVLVNEDSYTEGNETLTITLSNPTGGATLSCLTAVATIQITDDANELTANAIDAATDGSARGGNPRPEELTKAGALHTPNCRRW